MRREISIGESSLFRTFIKRDGSLCILYLKQILYRHIKIFRQTQAGINIRNYIIMLNIKDTLAAHAECDRKVILTEMFFFAYFRNIVCYQIVPSILIIRGNHFHKMVLSRGRRKNGLRYCHNYILYVVR